LPRSRHTSVTHGPANDFLSDDQIAAIGAQAVVAMRVTDARDTFIGVIVAMLSRPLSQADDSTALLQMLAARVGAELQRARRERELAESEAHLRQVQQVEAICGATARRAPARHSGSTSGRLNARPPCHPLATERRPPFLLHVPRFSSSTMRSHALDEPTSLSTRSIPPSLLS
jgi:hypothetical protein